MPGGWLSLLYAARFPAKVRRLVLVGAPVDLSIESSLCRLTRNAPEMVYDQLVARGGGNVRGEEMLHFWSKAPNRDDIITALQRDLSGAEGAALLARFERWNAETLDLPGKYYLEIVHRIFRENQIAGSSFVALGRRVDPKDVKAPVFLLAGLDDEVVPAAQALATAALLGTPPAFIAAASEPSNHLGLFMGARTHAHARRGLQNGCAAICPACWPAAPEPKAQGRPPRKSVMHDGGWPARDRGDGLHMVWN